MAIIQKIRDRYAKVAGGLIALALVAFIITSASESNIGNSIKELLGMKVNYVVKVDGRKVEQKEYIQIINNYETLFELYGRGRSLDDVSRAQLHDQALRELVYEQLASKQMDDLGIVSSKEEEKDIITGPQPDNMIQSFPYFQNPKSGGFDPNALAQFESKKLDMSDPNVKKALEQWEVVKDYVKRNHRIQKFNVLVASGIYVPKFLAERQVKDQGSLASIEFVKVPFTTINDNEAKVTDEDVNKYLADHKAQYTIDEPSRSIEYVSFEENPSTEDTAKTLESLTSIKAEFTTAANDENFVGRYSDEPYSGAYVTKNTLQSMFADSILAQPVGAVVGPYFENGAYKLTKVEEKKILPDSVKCRHILVRTEQQGQPVVADSVAKGRIDSIASAAKSGADFKAMAATLSDDEGSKANGGEYDFQLAQRGQLSKEFADFVFEGKAGETKIVKVTNGNYAGYHYIEILSQKGLMPSAKLATIAKALNISPETDQAIYASASSFAGKNTKAEQFDEEVKKEGLSKRQAPNVKMNDFTIEGIGASREIIRWMYEADKGDVSSIFKLENRYIVAKLTDIKDKGLMTPDAATRPQIEATIIADKKSKIIGDKYKGQASLAAISQASAQLVQQADSFNASSAFIPNVGPAPKVVGYAFYKDFKTGTISPALQGGDGVFFITLKSRTDAATANPAMIMQQLPNLEMQAKNGVSNSLMDVLRKRATIKYNVDMLY